METRLVDPAHTGDSVHAVAWPYCALLTVNVYFNKRHGSRINMTTSIDNELQKEIKKIAIDPEHSFTNSSKKLSAIC